MSYETLIHEMLDKLLGPDSSKITDSKWDREWCEKRYSIVEEYFKKVHEDTKKECIEVVTDVVDKQHGRYYVIEEIEKL